MASRRAIAEADHGTPETAARKPHERERQVGVGEGLTRGELDGLLGGGLYRRLGHDDVSTGLGSTKPAQRVCGSPGICVVAVLAGISDLFWRCEPSISAPCARVASFALDPWLERASEHFRRFHVQRL